MCQAEGGGIFDVLSDEEDCWMAEPSGLSDNDTPVQVRGWAAHGEHAGADRRQSFEAAALTRWVCRAPQSCIVPNHGA